MKNIYQLLFIVFFINLSFSQKKEKDSLNLIISKSANDSIRKIEYNNIFSSYKNKKPAIHYLFINKALSNESLIKDESYKALLIRELGVYYRKRGDLDSAIYHYNKSIKIYNKKKDSVGVYTVKGSLGNALKAKGDFKNSLINLNEALSFFEKRGEKGAFKVLMIKNNIGGLYVSIKDWKKADAFYEEIYKDPLVKNNKRFLNSVGNNLLVTKTNLNKLDKALFYALALEKTETRPRSLANLFLNIGDLYVAKKEFYIANKYYKKSLKQYKTINSSEGIIKIYNNLGNSFTKSKKYNEAEYYLLKANKILINDDNINSLQANYEMLATLYENIKDIKKALLYIKKGVAIKDSILSKEKLKSIAKYETLYKTEKSIREKENAEKQTKILHLENQKNKNLLASFTIIFSLLVLVAFFFFNRYKTKKKNELVLTELEETQKRLAVEKQYRTSELKALKAQMDPHFIFNALNSIQEYIVMNQKNLASDYLGKFASLMRKFLNYSDKGQISLYEEIETLTIYLELEKVRFEEKLNYQFKIENGLNTANYNIPTMLIQPYVENALKHGLLHLKNNRNLSISFSKNNNNIQCIIKDNGVGRKKSKELQAVKSKMHKSFATKATQERLTLLNFGKDKKIGVEIIDLCSSNKETGTKVIVTIPIV